MSPGAAACVALRPWTTLHFAVATTNSLKLHRMSTTCSTLPAALNYSLAVQFPQSVTLLVINDPMIRCKCHVRLWRWRSADAHYGLDKFSEFRWCSIYLPHAVDIQSMNIFLCLPLACLPSIIPVSATASNWFFIITWPTNRICLLTFRRFLDVLALWRTWSLDILLLIVQLSHPYNKVDHT